MDDWHVFHCHISLYSSDFPYNHRYLCLRSKSNRSFVVVQLSVTFSRLTYKSEPGDFFRIFAYPFRISRRSSYCTSDSDPSSSGSIYASHGITRVQRIFLKTFPKKIGAPEVSALGALLTGRCSLRPFQFPQN